MRNEDEDDPSWLRLDTLLRELIERTGQVLGNEQRVHHLLDAVVSIGRSLDHAAVVTSTINAARSLADAAHGALVLVGPDGRPSLDDLVGPSVLGVPVRVRDELYAVLYVTGKRRGEFSQADEDVLVALSAAAGIAIENARSYEKTARSERWLQASNEIMSRLLSGSTARAALELIAERAGEVAGADLALLAQLDESGDRLVVEVATGTGAEEVRGRGTAIDGTALPDILRLGAPRTYELTGADGAIGWLSNLVSDQSLLEGSAIVVPLGVATQPAGVLTMVRSAASPPFDEVDLRLAETFAGHAALALEFGQIQADREELAVFQDRDRIARDLHDRVIQRLFAVALGLLGVSRQALPPQIAERVGGYVRDLDATIAEIRRTIFFLQEEHAERPSLRAQLLDAADSAAGRLGFDPHVELSGPLDAAVADDLRPQLVSTVREALADVAEHGGAQHVSVYVRADVEAELLVVEVQHDGTQPYRDLSALAARADTYGGKFEAGERAGGGFRLLWQLPLEC